MAASPSIRKTVYRCYDHFSVEKIAYDEKGKIIGLAIRNDTKNMIKIYTYF